MKYSHQKLPGPSLLTLLNPPTDSEEIRMSEEDMKGPEGSHARNAGQGAFLPQVQVKNKVERDGGKPKRGERMTHGSHSGPENLNTEWIQEGI